LTTFGSDLGLSEIRGEASTRDGLVYDPLFGPVPKVVGGDDALIQAVDGLQFTGRDTLLAYRSGVTRGFTAPLGAGFFRGLGVAYSTGALHKLEKGAIVQKTTALHVYIGHLGQPSISTQVAALRKLLLGFIPEDDDVRDRETANAFKQVTSGVIPVVVHTQSADIIATVISLKQEVEDLTGVSVKITVAGGTEAHLLAAELAAAHIGVIVINARPYPAVWEQKRILPGPPLSENSTLSTLLSHGVETAIGVSEAWMARNTRLDVAWAALESDMRISKEDAIALASTSLDKLLGGKGLAEDIDLVATEGGGLLEFSGKVVGVMSPLRSTTDLF